MSRKSVQRSFDIGLSDPRGRARLVAIAATELVLASWVELDANQRLHVEPVGRAPSAGATKAARDITRELLSERYQPKSRSWSTLETPDDRALRIVPLVSARGFINHVGTLWGGGLRMGEERFRFVSWAADVVLESGVIRGTDTEYRVTTGTVGGMAFAYVSSPAITGRIGAGLRVGFAGTEETRHRLGASSSLVPWGWPLGALSTTLRLLPDIGLELSSEAGYVSLPVRGNGGFINGFWYSAQAGITILLQGGPARRPAAGEAEE